MWDWERMMSDGEALPAEATADAETLNESELCWVSSRKMQVSQNPGLKDVGSTLN